MPSDKTETARTWDFRFILVALVAFFCAAQAAVVFLLNWLPLTLKEYVQARRKDEKRGDPEGKKLLPAGSDSQPSTSPAPPEFLLGPHRSLLLLLAWAITHFTLWVLVCYAIKHGLVLGTMGAVWECAVAFVVVCGVSDTLAWAFVAVEELIDGRKVNPAKPLLSSVMSWMPVLGPRPDLYRDYMLLAIIEMLVLCTDESWKRLLGMLMLAVSVISIILPMIFQFRHQDSRFEASEEFCSALACRGTQEPSQATEQAEDKQSCSEKELETNTEEGERDWVAEHERRTWFQRALVPKLALQTTNAKFYTIVVEEAPQGVIAIGIWAIFGYGGPIVVYSLVVTLVKITFVVVLRRGLLPALAIYGAAKEMKFFLNAQSDPVERIHKSFLMDPETGNDVDVLTYVAARGNDSMISVLVEVRADVNKKDVDGFTPLDRAISDYKCKEQMMAVLLKAGAKAEKHIQRGDGSWQGDFD